MDTQLLSQVSPFIYFEGNKAYSNNGSILKGYRLVMPEIFSLDKAEYEEIHTMWYRALRDLPVRTIVHKMDLYLNEKFSFPGKANTSFLQKATEDHFNGMERLAHHSMLFFIYPNSAILNSPKIQNPFQKPIKSKEAIESIEKSSSYFNVDVARAIEFINTSRYIKAEPLSEEEFSYLEQGYFNGFYRDRVTDYDIKNSTMGDKKVGVYSISNLHNLGEVVKTSIEDASISEREWVYHQGFMDNLALKLDCEHIYNQVIYIRDHAQEKKQIEKTKNTFYGARRFGKEYERDSEKLGEYLVEMADDEKIKLVYGHNNVIYFANSKEQYELLSERIPTLFKSLDMMPYYPTGKNKANLISNSFPGFIGNLNADNYFGPIDLQQCLCMFTNNGPYKDDDSGIYFNERLKNIPVKKDIWDREKKRIKARNFFIVAPTGEGKSMLFNHIARQMYEDNVAVVIVDLGGSYRKLAALYPDDTVYIRYKEGEPIGLNPFAKEEGKPVTAEKIEELATFVFKIWKKERLPNDVEKVALKKILDAYYKNVHKGHSFPDFYDFINQYQDGLTKKLELTDQVSLNDFLLICSEFVGEGIYSFLFKSSSESSEKIGDKKFIVFELDEVKENEVLLTIMIHLISETVRKVIWKDRKNRGIIFFDEFAKMLKFPSVLDSAEYFNQAIRKYEGAAGYVIQSPAQLPEGDTSDAMIDNTQVMYILQNDKGYDSVVKRFGMRKHQQVQLQSIRNNFDGERPYSEFMLVLGKESNVYRLEVPKEVYLAYQTEGHEYQDVMDLYKQTGSMEIAINKYLGK